MHRWQEYEYIYCQYDDISSEICAVKTNQNSKTTNVIKNLQPQFDFLFLLTRRWRPKSLKLHSDQKWLDSALPVHVTRMQKTRNAYNIFEGKISAPCKSKQAR
jgi:hypothetical protein